MDYRLCIRPTLSSESKFLWQNLSSAQQGFNDLGLLHRDVGWNMPCVPWSWHGGIYIYIYTHTYIIVYIYIYVYYKNNLMCICAFGCMIIAILPPSRTPCQRLCYTYHWIDDHPKLCRLSPASFEMLSAYFATTWALGSGAYHFNWFILSFERIYYIPIHIYIYMFG